MSKFTPWTDEGMKTAMTDAYLLEAEEASKCCEDCRARLTYSDRYFDAGFSKGVAWAAAQIEKCETIYYRDSDHEERVIVAGPECFELDTHEAKLVGVREVNHE